MVDLPTGRLSQTDLDFDIPGLIPLTLKRHYRSTNLWLGDLGYGWAHPFGIQLVEEKDLSFLYRGVDGRRIPFPRPAPPKPSIQPSEKVALTFVPQDKLSWPALRAELVEGAFMVQAASPFTLLFDARRAGKLFPWRGIADACGNLVLVVPDPDGAPARVEAPRGLFLHFRRDRAGLLVEVELSEGRASAKRLSLVRYEYDVHQDLVAVHDAAGTRTYEYKKHLLTRHRDRCGGACESTFDRLGRCVRTCGAGKTRERTYTYDEEHFMTVVRDGFGNASSSFFLQNMLVNQTIDPVGGKSFFDYDAENRLVLATDQMGHQTAICYSEGGAQVGKVRPDGSANHIETNNLGLRVCVTSAAGLVTKFGRDALGRVVQMMQPGQAPCAIAYAADGSMGKMKLPSGKEVTLTWSEDGKTLTEADAEGVLTEQQFDVFGRLVAFTNALGAKTCYEYDGAGYLAAIVYPDGTRRQFVYDAEGRLTKLEDEASSVTQWEYDVGGRRAGVILPNGATMRFTYDVENRLTGMQGPDGLWHRYFYDARGLVVRQEFADGRVEHYEYDGRGLLVKLVDPSGAAIVADRDPVGHLHIVHYPDGTAKEAWHDPDGNWLRVELNGHGLRRELDEGQPVVERQDDFIVFREFGPAGELAAVTLSLGRKVAYVYDEDLRVVEAVTTAGAWKEGAWEPVSAPRAHRFRYDRVGNLVAWEMPSGNVEERKYDVRRRLVEQTVKAGGTVVLRRKYTYNPGGRLAVLDDSRRGKKHFAYDVLGRIEAVRDAGGDTQNFRYSQEGDVQFDGLQYEPGHRLRRVNGQELTYDARGFVTQRGREEFTYTVHGLLSAAKLSDGSDIHFEYDPHDRLLKRSTASGQTRYFWNEERLWALQETGRPPVEFLYLPGHYLPCEQAQGERVYSVHTDHQGKIQELLDDAGNVVWSVPEGVWGEVRMSSASGGVECPFGFPGQILDPATGLFYNRNRFYYPDGAHYLTPDPIGIWGGLDAYAYVPDPINLYDPNGLACRGTADDPTLYRGDDRPPSEICAKGFAPRNPAAGLTVAQHVEGCPGGGSNWVSTAYDAEEAEKFGGDTVYVIANPGCGVEVDCDPDVQAKYGNSSSETEIAFNKPIPPGNVVGYYSKSAGGSSFQACP